MKIVIKTANVKLTPILRQYIEEKINPLEKFVKMLYNEKYLDDFFGKGKPKVEAWVEIGKISRHHQKGLIFRAEAQLRFPGRSIRSEARSEDLRIAITEVKDDLQRELKQYKNKLIAQTKKGARALKKELKISPKARFYRKGRIREEGI